MANDIRKFVKGVGITPTTSSPISEKGEMRVNDSDGKLRYHNGTSESAVVTESHTATLTNKTIDGDDNTLQDIGLGSLKTVAGDANKVIRRDGSGAVVSDNTLPNSSPIVTTDAAQTLTGKTIDGDDNTLQDIGLGALKTLIGDANKVIRRDSSGAVISGNTLPNLSPIVTTDATQTLTGKTIDGDDNTLQDVGLGALKTVIGDANKVIRRDGSGAVISGNDLPNLSQIVTTDATQTLTSKTISGASNTVNDLALSSLATDSGNANRVLKRDPSGNVISGNPIPNSTAEVLTTSDTQVITNKDIDGGTASDSRRITLPRDTYTNISGLTRKEGTILYATDTDKVYIDDGVNLKEIGSGGGELNFLQLSNKAWDAESGITGWSTYKDAAAARPVDGTGGTATVVSAISTTSTNPLSGTKSFLFAKSSGNAQGEGWSVDFSIDNAHLARVLQVEFDYQVVSGDFIAGNAQDFTTAGDSSLIVYLYDVTNNQLIEPTTFRLYSNATNLADKFVGNFQTSATSTSYRLIFHVARTETAAWTLKVDNVVVRPSKYTYGAPISDWKEYTPTFNSGFTVGTGGYAYNKWYWRRVGGDCEIRGSFQLGASGFSMGSGNFTFTLPSGLSLDESRLNGTGFGNNGSDWARVGVVTLKDSGGTGESSLYFVMRNASSLNSFFIGGKTDSGVSFAINSTAPFTWGSGDELHVYAMSVPIAGWSSSVKVAEPMERRDVVFHIYGISSDASQSIASNTWAKVSGHWNVANKYDSCNGWDATNSEYVAPTSGNYVVQAAILAVKPINDNMVDVGIGINGSSPSVFVDLDRPVVTSSADLQRVKLTFMPRVIPLKAGDRVSVWVSPRGFTLNNVGGWTHTQFTIYKLPSSQVLADSETVVVRANNMSGPTLIADSGTNIGNWTKQVDTHNSFNATSGVFTAPQPGHYLVCAQAILNSANTNGVFVWTAAALSSEGLGNEAFTTCNGGTSISGFNGSFAITAYKSGAQFQIRVGMYGTGGNRTIRNVNPTDCTLSITKIK